jgi:outer membrane protein assembly factor BamB
MISSDGTIYGGWDWFYAINPDGTVKWRFGDPRSGQEVTSTPLISSDGTIYFGGGGSLVALNIDSTLKWTISIGHTSIQSSVVIGTDGTIYFGANDGYFYAVQGSGQLGNTPWPKFRHDSKNTGRFGGP